MGLVDIGLVDGLGVRVDVRLLFCLVEMVTFIGGFL